VAPVYGKAGANDRLSLAWGWQGNYLEPTFAVLGNGALLTNTEAQEYALGPTLAGNDLEAAVAACSPLEATLDLTTAFYRPPRGSRATLTAPAVDLAANPDFESYVFAWSADGSEPTEVMAYGRGAAGNVARTPLLDDGVTYKFAVALRDIHGNQTAWGATTSLAVNGRPVAPTSAGAVYSATPRTAVVTAALPASQAADCAGYELLSNYLPGAGLQEALVEEVLAWLPAAAAALTFTTPELCSGHWIFGWRAVDQFGVASESAEVELNLAVDGAALVEADAQPPAPLITAAQPGAGGTVDVTVRLSGDVTGTRLYVDGVADEELVVTEADEVTVTTSALAGGVAVTITATALNGDAESAASAGWAVTPDDTAPTGDTTLTAVLAD
jgi:hypothetical protein